jgi:hypothetical protein
MQPPRLGSTAGAQPEDGPSAACSKPDIVQIPAGADTRRSMPTKAVYVSSSHHASTCVEPDHEELIRSVSSVLQHRVRDNEQARAPLSARARSALPTPCRARRQVGTKAVLPLFCEDTHTDEQPEDR